MKNSKCWDAVLMCIMTLMASHLASAGEYHYPNHLPQRTVKFSPYADPGNGPAHSTTIRLEPIDAKYFSGCPLDSVTLEFHYCDKKGNDCLGKNRNQNSDGKGGNYSGFTYKKKGKLGDIEALLFYWFVVTKVESEGLTYCGYNRFYLENPQVGDVYRCYLLYNQGEHSWVSQEFGVQCGGKGHHSHCPQCFMPVTVPRNRTLAAATAERLKKLTHEDESVSTASNSPHKVNATPRYEIIPWMSGWHTAKADAEARGGHLATITSEEEWNTICQLFSPEELKGTWLGATDENTEGSWQWVTGEQFTYARWSAGEPNNWKGLEHYLAIQTFDTLPWNDYSEPHKDVTKYLFERETGSVPAASRTASKKPEIPQKSRYELIPWTGGWHSAKVDSEARGGHLATITSEKEWEEISGQFSPGELAGTWFGATDEKTEGIWEWVTGEPFAYARWGAGEPNNDRGIEHFLGTKNKADCSWNDFPDTYWYVTKYLLEYEIGNASILMQPKPIDIVGLTQLPETGTPDSLRQMTRDFENNIGKINTLADEKHKQLESQLSELLDRAIASARQTGDFDTLVALMEFKEKADTATESALPFAKKYIAFRAKKAAEIEDARMLYALKVAKTFYANLAEAKTTETRKANLDAAKAFSNQQQKMGAWIQEQTQKRSVRE